MIGIDKPLIVIGHVLDDYDTASKFAALLNSFIKGKFDVSPATLGRIVFPQRDVAIQDTPPSSSIALQILLASQIALESQWLAVAVGFSRAKGIPTISIRLHDYGAHDLPESLTWFDATDINWPQGWSIFCQKCRLKCPTFPGFVPSMEELSKVFNRWPEENDIILLEFPRQLEPSIDEVVLQLKCWPDEDEMFRAVCSEAGIVCRNGGQDSSTTALDIIADDFILRLMRRHMDDLSIPHFPVSGYDEPPKPGHYPHTRIYEINFTFSVKAAAFRRVASILDVWRARMKVWKPVQVEVRLSDQWDVDRVRLRQFINGILPSDLITDLDEAILVEGIVIRLGNPRLIKRFDLRFQTLAFNWKGRLTDCRIWEAINKTLDLRIIRSFKEH